MFANKKIAIIGCGYFKKEIQEKGVDCISLYRSKIWRMVIYVLLNYLHVPVRDLFFQHNWIEPFKEHDIIILFDCSSLGNEEDLMRRIERGVSKRTRLIYYRWNTYDTIGMVSLSPKWEHWTFDFEDAREHHIKFANTFYMIDNKSNTEEVHYDVSFVGLDKGRKVFLEKINEKLKNVGFTTFFYIIEKSRFFRKKKLLPYSEVKRLVQISKTVLEVQKSHQVGLSLRALEALFFDKKLITNNKFISQYSFYDPCNIYCLTDLYLCGIKQFMDVQNVRVSNAIKEYYLFEQWLTRLINNEEAVL